MNKKYYVYTLSSSIDDEIFYVGKGSSKRIIYHEWVTKKNDIGSRYINLHLSNKIKKLWKNGGEVLKSKIFESNNEQECFNCEIDKIAEIGLNNLCNIEIGGQGYSHSEETRRKIGVGNKGKIVSTKTRRKISKARKGIRFSEETRKKMSEAQKGSKNHNYRKKFSDKVKTNMSLAQQKRWTKKEIA